MEEKHCLECHTPLHGRSDKRFCDDGCRNAYNNKLNSDQHNITRNINNVLRKNRRILAEFLGQEKMIKISEEKLKKQGFSFTYHTHLLKTTKGLTYVFVYEYGYLELDNNIYLLVKQRSETK